MSSEHDATWERSYAVLLEREQAAKARLDAHDITQAVRQALGAGYEHASLDECLRAIRKLRGGGEG